MLNQNTWAAKAKRTITSVLPVDKARNGSCRRCGKCCHLPTRCSFLVTDEQGVCSCKIWLFRPLNCRKYPRTAGENLTQNTCGYIFDQQNQS